MMSQAKMIIWSFVIAIPITAILVGGIFALTLWCFPNENICTATGQFYGSYEATDQNGNSDTYYQFKSNDNEVWWALTAEEIGFIPNANEEYTLTYDNNGTTKVCDCSDCECEVYDDIFIGIK